MADIDTTQTGRPPILTRRESTSPSPAELENNEMMLMEINERLGFLKGLVSNINTFLTREEIDDDKLQEENNKLFETMAGRVMNRREALLKAGASGTAAVYIGDKLEGVQESFEESMTDDKKGLFGKLKGLLGGGLAGAGGMLGRLLGGKAARLGGLAAFAALKWDDIADAIGMFQEGDIMKGISTLLLGDIDKVTGGGMFGGILKQGGAWAGMGLAIGGPIGALVGFAAGAIGKAIQSAVKATRDAYEEEWDLQAEDIYAQKQKAREEAEGFREKFRALSDEVFTTIGITFAGAKRAAEEYEGEGRSKVVGWITGFIDKVAERRAFKMFGDDPEKMKAFKDMQKEAKEKRKEIFDKINGFFNKVGDYTGDFFRTLRDKGLRGLKDTKIVQDIGTAIGEARENWAQRWEQTRQGAKEAWQGFTNKVAEGFNTARDKWKATIAEIKEKGLGVWLEERWQEAKANLELFWQSMRDMWQSVSDFFKRVGKHIGQTVKTAWDTIMGGQLGAIEGVIRRQQEGKLTEEEAIKQLVQNRRFRKWAEETTGQDLFTAFGKVRGTEEVAQLLKLYREDMGQLVGTIGKEVETVDDAIIRPGGKIIRTNPRDTLIATKAFDDGTMNQILNSSNRSSQTENQMLNVLMQVRDKIGAGGGQVVQNNFTSRFNPGNVMQQGMVEVF